MMPEETAFDDQTSNDMKKSNAVEYHKLILPLSSVYWVDGKEEYMKCIEHVKSVSMRSVDHVKSIQTPAGVWKFLGAVVQAPLLKSYKNSVLMMMFLILSIFLEGQTNYFKQWQLKEAVRIILLQ